MYVQEFKDCVFSGHDFPSGKFSIDYNIAGYGRFGQFYQGSGSRLPSQDMEIPAGGQRRATMVTPAADFRAFPRSEFRQGSACICRVFHHARGLRISRGWIPPMPLPLTGTPAVRARPTMYPSDPPPDARTGSRPHYRLKYWT